MFAGVMGLGYSCMDGLGGNRKTCSHLPDVEMNPLGPLSSFLRVGFNLKRCTRHMLWITQFSLFYYAQCNAVFERLRLTPS